MIAGLCWRCEEPGHPAAECQRPPPQTRAELQARIDRHVERWIDGATTISQKTKYVKAEVTAFEKERTGK